MTEKNRHMAFISSKGSLDMVYPVLIMANAARMEGADVDIFFTFWGLDMITKRKMDKLGVATVGNPNMHPWFHIPSWLGSIPGMSAMATWMMRREIAKLGFPPVGEFVQLLLDSGAKLWGCKATLDMMKLTPKDLVEGIEVATATEFIEMSAGAQIIFV
jgi:peroxiredoxin family protein